MSAEDAKAVYDAVDAMERDRLRLERERDDLKRELEAIKRIDPEVYQQGMAYQEAYSAGCQANIDIYNHVKRERDEANKRYRESLDGYAHEILRLNQAIDGALRINWSQPHESNRARKKLTDALKESSDE